MKLLIFSNKRCFCDKIKCLYNCCRYCYAGMRKRIKLEVPKLPDLGDEPQVLFFFNIKELVKK